MGNEVVNTINGAMTTVDSDAVANFASRQGRGSGRNPRGNRDITGPSVGNGKRHETDTAKIRKALGQAAKEAAGKKLGLRGKHVDTYDERRNVPVKLADEPIEAPIGTRPAYKTPEDADFAADVMGAIAPLSDDHRAQIQALHVESQKVGYLFRQLQEYIASPEFEALGRQNPSMAWQKQAETHAKANELRQYQQQLDAAFNRIAGTQQERMRAAVESLAKEIGWDAKMQRRELPEFVAWLREKYQASELTKNKIVGAYRRWRGQPASGIRIKKKRDDAGRFAADRRPRRGDTAAQVREVADLLYKTGAVT